MTGYFFWFNIYFMPYKALRSFSYRYGGSQKIIRKDREITEAQFQYIPDDKRKFFEEMDNVKVVNKPSRAIRSVSETTKVREPNDTVMIPNTNIRIKPPTVVSEQEKIANYPQSLT